MELGRQVLADPDLRVDRADTRQLHLVAVAVRPVQALQPLHRAVVDVDELGFADPAEQAARALEPGPVQPRLAVFPARPDRGAPQGVRPSELLRIANPSADVTVTGTGGLGG